MARGAPGKPFVTGQDLRRWKATRLLLVLSPNTAHDPGIFLGRISPGT